MKCVVLASFYFRDVVDELGREVEGVDCEGRYGGFRILHSPRHTMLLGLTDFRVALPNRSRVPLAYSFVTLDSDFSRQLRPTAGIRDQRTAPGESYPVAFRGRVRPWFRRPLWIEQQIHHEISFLRNHASH